MKEIGILFSGQMVKALLAGTKTQTRRTRGLDYFNESPDLWRLARVKDGAAVFHGPGPCRSMASTRRLYDVGDLLWVRETWGLSFQKSTTLYRADFNPKHPFQPRWKPGIHMKRADSRILLEITEVRVQRVMDISEADAVAEGFEAGDGVSAWQRFSGKWDEINGKRKGRTWSDNPWAWCLTFKVISTTRSPAKLAASKR